VSIPRILLCLLRGWNTLSAMNIKRKASIAALSIAASAALVLAPAISASAVEGSPQSFQACTGTRVAVIWVNVAGSFTVSQGPYDTTVTTSTTNGSGNGNAWVRVPGAAQSVNWYVRTSGTYIDSYSTCEA